MSRVIILIILIIPVMLLLAAHAFGGGDEDILGSWNTEDGRARIEIFPCDGHYCGKIVWLKQPEYPRDDKQGMGGNPRVDRDNPDPALRGRRLLGLQILAGFTYRGAATWGGGTVYDPESGTTYQSKIRLVSPQRLEIRGYVGIPLFGRTTTWTRRPAGAD